MLRSPIRNNLLPSEAKGVCVDPVLRIKDGGSSGPVLSYPCPKTKSQDGGKSTCGRWELEGWGWKV